ncbi:MAG: hypothetical protein QW464_02195 [Ignisphaera sp.]
MRYTAKNYELTDKIAGNLLSYGINVTGYRLLLPITPDGGNAKSFKELAEMGVAWINLENDQVTISMDLLGAMQKTSTSDAEQTICRGGFGSINFVKSKAFCLW